MCNVNNENGRSMIEMLGVLAIIGVLSVGGIAGYSKAMTTYKANKALQQISLIVSNMQSFFGHQRQYVGMHNMYDTNDGKSVIQKAKIIPDEMVIFDDDNKLNSAELPVGPLLIRAFPKSFIIDISSFEDNESLCIEFMSKDWNSINGFIGIGSKEQGLDDEDLSCPSDTYTYCANEIPLSLEKAVDFCSKNTGIIGSDGAGIQMKFR